MDQSSNTQAQAAEVRGEADGARRSALALHYGSWDDPRRDAACRSRALYRLRAEREPYCEGFLRGWAVVADANVGEVSA